MLHRGRTWIVVVAIAALLAAACGDDASEGSTSADNNETESPAVGEPVAGGSVTYLNQGELPTLDPAGNRMGTTLALLLTAVYDVLVIVEPDGTIVPRLAESVDSDDALTWTVRLREGVTFSDGTDFDAEAVMAHWDRMADPEVASPGLREVERMESRRVVDPLTIEVTLQEPMRQWPRLLMRDLGAIPSPTAVETLGDDFGSQPVGAGPYLVEEWVRDSRLSLVRNPTYWDSPKPYLDAITVRPVIDSQSRYDSIAVGEADFSLHALYDGGLTAAIEQDFDVRFPAVIGGQGHVFNFAGDGPTSDIRVRRALSLATDHQDLNEKLNRGLATPVTEGLFPEGSPFHQPDFGPPLDNLAEGQELIDDYIAENGGPIELEIVTPEQVRTQDEAVQQQWMRLDGVNIQVNAVEVNDLVTRQRAGDFDIIAFTVSGVDPEPIAYDRLHSTGSQNYAGFSDPRVDAALEAGRIAEDLEERREAYADLEEAVWDIVPVIFYFPLPNATVVGPDIRGFDIIDEGIPDFTNTWLDRG